MGQEPWSWHCEVKTQLSLSRYSGTETCLLAYREVLFYLGGAVSGNVISNCAVTR